MASKFKAIVIGVSAGGFKALHSMLPMFSAQFPLPIIIVQHRNADADSYFITSLNNVCQMPVKEPLDKTKIEPGNIYISPGGYHLLVEKDYYFSLSVDMPVCYCRPSIDVLFESAAEVFGSGLVGIILTGANYDGSNGIKAIKSLGGITIAQNPKTAEVNYMPACAIKTNAIDHILNLDEIPGFIEKIL
ncbi:MAG: chemotaxis protein CheB [Desulfamplus sp.]|nr:chemotaxis protein CheB [Desulfamplus sp.]